MAEADNVLSNGKSLSLQKQKTERRSKPNGSGEMAVHKKMIYGFLLVFTKHAKSVDIKMVFLKDISCGDSLIDEFPNEEQNLMR